MDSKRHKVSLKNKALHYLSLREHSRLELSRKLARYAQESEDIESLLDFLENNGFLSCERFTESLVRRRSESYGNSRILAELQSHNLDPQLLAKTKIELADSEVGRAREVWKKKFGHQKNQTLELTTPPNLVEQRAKQARFLAQRGFSSAAIQKVLNGVAIGDGQEDMAPH